MDEFKNHYRTLQVDASADEAAIKAAFRRLALRYHPDRARTAHAGRRFQEIREAYEVLSDPNRRRDYDRVYRAQTAVRLAPASAVRRRTARPVSGGAGLGITVDLLGLRIGLGVDAAAVRRPASSPRRRRKKR